jgi:hypothetical protein
VTPQSSRDDRRLARCPTPRLRGRNVRLAIERTSDHATAAYNLPLRGGPVGWGNMIAQQDSCVVAEAELLAAGDQDGGPLAKTH